MAKTFTPEDVASFEHATWSRCAAGYDDGFAVLTAEAIPRLLESVNAGPATRLLDVGTGTGRVVASAVARGADAVGIDFSDAMIAEARRRHPDLDFRAAPADALPFTDGSFDALTANGVLHHLGDPARALAEAARVLTHHGRVACTVWAEPERLEAFGLFFAAVERHAGPADLPHGPLFGVTDPEIVESLFGGAGFADIEFAPLEITWRMESIDSLISAFGTWAQLDSFPDAIRSAIESDVSEAASAYGDNGGFTIPNPMLLISATRSP